MPRPPVKRSKLDQANQASKRVTNNGPSASPATLRRQLTDSLARKQVGRVPNDSDDSDLLVTRSSTRNNRRGVPPQEIYASGGVARGDKVAAHTTPTGKKAQTTQAQSSKVAAEPNSSRVLRRLDQHQSAPDSEQVSWPTKLSLPAQARTKPFATGSMSAKYPRVTTQGTASAETSILGPIKIRKRQSSILQMVDAPDSSILDQDLDEFLPDDESTPLDGSRKRKLSANLLPSTPEVLARSVSDDHQDETGARDPLQLQPDLSTESASSGSRREKPAPETESDTMASPRSSSSLSSSPHLATTRSPPKTRVVTRKKKEPNLSTLALQSLMPARRQLRARRGRVIEADSGFTISEDSSDAQNRETRVDMNEVVNEESYIISPVRTKKGRKASSAKIQRAKKPTAKSGKQNPMPTQLDRRPKNKSRRAGTHSSPLARSTPLSAAKKFQQRNFHKGNLTGMNRSRRLIERSIDDANHQSESEDKENRRSGSLGRFSKQGIADHSTATNPYSSDNEHHEFEKGRRKPVVEGRDSRQIWDAEQTRLAKKFKEVDEWEMEFEDVTFNEGSDSLAR